MTDTAIYDVLRKLNMRGSAEEYQYQCEHPAIYRDMDFDSRLKILLNKETERRSAKKIQRLIRQADFKFPDACVENILYDESRHLDKEKINTYAACGYIDDYMNLIIQGATGSGKTWLSCALGVSACRQGRKVRYIRAPQLLEELMVAKETGDLHNFISGYARYDEIIIDDWLISSLNVDETLCVLEFLEGCEKRCSLVFCTQYPSDAWYDRINSNEENKPVGEAVFERIIFSSDNPIKLQGESSIREKLWKERVGKATRKK